MLSIGDAVIGLADLRGRCIMTTWDPDTQEQDIDVFLHIRDRFGGRLALNAWAGARDASPSATRCACSSRAVELELPYVGRSRSPGARRPDYIPRACPVSSTSCAMIVSAGAGSPESPAPWPPA